MGPCVPALQCPTLLRREPPHQPLIDLGGAAQHVQVFGDGRLHLGPLHLDRDHLARLLQHGAVHLGERGGGDGLGAELVEDVVDGTAHLLLDDLAGDLGLEALDAVLQRGELVERRLRQDVRADGHHLPHLDVGGAELLEVDPRVARELRRVLLEGVGAAADEERRHARDERHRHAEELHPPLLQRAALLVPVRLDRRAVVDHRQPVGVDDALAAFVHRDEAAHRLRRRDAFCADAARDLLDRGGRRRRDARRAQVVAAAAVVAAGLHRRRRRASGGVQLRRRMRDEADRRGAGDEDRERHGV